ncbi:DUF86 domain-containing protein [Parashewanella curva]|uniref:DUF86 domain-containing protein n=1 Tax=Parashewanella curva TaxID=2338552 RepID=A0A3L8Q1Q1_9GAMM|nr:DUF86 domain-containing protein [Parashewanella curva]RLV61400.1 DUF86 domain-containing protein [Parashewanella curva]
MNDILMDKASIIRRCISRINEVYRESDNFRLDFTRQDSVILNLQRACEASIDMANVVIKTHKLSVPQSSRDSFSILEKSSHLSPELSEKMQRMVGLRNIAVHEYQSLNLDIVINVIENDLSDFEDFIIEIR